MDVTNLEPDVLFGQRSRGRVDNVSKALLTSKLAVPCRPNQENGIDLHQAIAGTYVAACKLCRDGSISHEPCQSWGPWP